MMYPDASLCAAPRCPRVMEFARRLHDELSQTLVFALIRLDEAQGRGDLSALGGARTAVQAALQATRQLMQARPAAEREQDLSAHLRKALETLRPMQGSRELSFLSEGPLPALKPEVQEVLQTATRELLANACKHGGQEAIKLRLSAQSHRLAITVSNSTLDFDPQSWLSSEQGLAFTRSRLHSIGARLRWRQAERQVQARITWSSSS